MKRRKVGMEDMFEGCGTYNMTGCGDDILQSVAAVPLDRIDVTDQSASFICHHLYLHLHMIISFLSVIRYHMYLFHVFAL